MSDAEKSCRELIGLNIKKHRRQQGLTQEDLAFEMGMSRSYLSQVETARKNISIDNVERIADALDVDPRELLKPTSEWDEAEEGEDE